MPIFSDPVTLTDGTDPHIFSFRAQLPDKKSIIGEWVEPASALSAESRLIIKHDETSSTVKRRLVQRKVKKPLLDPTVLSPITVNVTVTHHPEHTQALIQDELDIVVDALTEANFVQNLLQGLI